MSTCAACNQHFSLSAKAIELLKKFPDEPEPSYCVPCGHKRRLLFRNGRNLYRRKCDFTGDPIISIYAPEKPYTVYKADVWWSDKWDPLSYGRDIDWNRPFFEQLCELQLKVPRLALTNIKAENSDYCNMTQGNRNCYLIFGGDFNEDCMYGTFGMHNKNISDSDTSNHNERCYFLGDSYHCYDTSFGFDSQNCSSCAFISDCIGCSDCILGTNLVKKSYCIRSKQLTKEEYEKQKQELLSGSYHQQQKNWKEFLELRSHRIVKFAHILSSEDCTGDYIQGSKGCHNCFDTWESEDLSDVILASQAKDSLLSGCITGELCYDLQSAVGTYNARHSCSVFDSSDIEYCDMAFHSKNIFGCVGAKKMQYCILNKQYEKEEYVKLRSQLATHMKKTGEWGRFLPQVCSPFAYNESTALSYFPLTKEQAAAEGFAWFEHTEPPMEVTKTILAVQLPDAIDDIPYDIVNWAIECEETKRSFKILKQELDFYRSLRLPVPRLHPDQRYAKRLALRNPLKLYARTCTKCETAIETTYAPDRPAVRGSEDPSLRGSEDPSGSRMTGSRREIVYCESCYLETVY